MRHLIQKNYFSILIILFLLINCNLINAQSLTWKRPILAGLECYSVASDSNNYIYSLCEYTSHFQSPNLFDTVPVPSTLPEFGNIFVTKSDTNFNIKWMKIMESSWSFNRPKMEISSEQKIVIATSVWDRFKLDSIDMIFPNHEEPPIVIVQLDSSGNIGWMNLIQNNTYFIEITDIAFDSQKNVYVIGNTVSNITFGNLDSSGVFLPSITLVPTINSTSTFLAKYSPVGEFISATMFPLANTSQGDYLKINSMIIDNDDNIYLTGWFQGIIQYNNSEIESDGAEIIILKFNMDMELVWSKQFGPGNIAMIEQGKSLAFDKSKKNFYITGNFIGSKDFGNGLIYANDRNIFLAKYTTDGMLKWIHTSGCNSGMASYTEEGQVVYVDKADFVYLGGKFSRTLFIGDTTLNVYIDPNVANDYFDFFIAKYYANGVFSWATNAGSNYSDKLASITKDNNNHVFVCGATNSESYFGEYTLVTPPNALSAIGFVACFNDKPEINQFEESYGIEEQTNGAEKIKIFPNPFINNLEVEVQNENHSAISLQMIDLQGKTIISTLEESGNINQTFSYQFNNKASGIYCLLITIGDSIYTYKIVKL